MMADGDDGRCPSSLTNEKSELTNGCASRVGLTPSPTCLPGQGGSRKGMRPLRQRNGSRDLSALLGQPMEGFFMGKHSQRSVELFTPDEQAIMAQWCGAE